MSGSLHVGSPRDTSALDSSSPNPLPHEAFHTLVLSGGPEESGVLLRAPERAEAILVAGEPLQQEVVQHGPFVMTTVEEIRKAISDCE